MTHFTHPSTTTKAIRLREIEQDGLFSSAYRLGLRHLLMVPWNSADSVARHASLVVISSEVGSSTFDTNESGTNFGKLPFSYPARAAFLQCNGDKWISEVNLLEARAALFFEISLFFLRCQFSFQSAHLFLPACAGQLTQFCEIELYFWIGRIFLKRH